MWLWHQTPLTWAPEIICPLEITFNREPLSETLEVWHVSNLKFDIFHFSFITICHIYVWLMVFRELHGAICSNSLFGLGQHSNERRLWHKLPTVTLLACSSTLSLLNESLYSELYDHTSTSLQERLSLRDLLTQEVTEWENAHCLLNPSSSSSQPVIAPPISIFRHDLIFQIAIITLVCDWHDLAYSDSIAISQIMFH